MTGLNHDWDAPYGPGHADFKHGAVDIEDFLIEFDYKPRKKKTGCKRSKNGEPCSFTNKVYRNQWYSKSNKLWTVIAVMTCSRCGKHDWKSYKYTYRKEPVN